MDLDELVRSVQSLKTEDGFYARLGLPEWRTLGTYLTPYQLRSGDLLIKQGDIDRTAYFLASGSLQIYVAGATPGSSRIVLLRPGALVGETGLFSDAPHTANVEAMTPAVVWALQLPRFEELAQRAPGIALEFMRAAGAVLTCRARAQQTLRTAMT
ncbi:hypothetical protein C7444_101303 [Sphaerotilus hippei]|uniref:Cyclic nucleotide-binding domain-containing protein n=1 Tax=Sphaerotilus hippei TaxID=744406 RepID=A0A318HHD0_9BURK|nr:cyclic nucleotide-binding domain-containing protein [Sphaerotilus hippei]PXW99473.1 hypothetical protein C7444_101303 [Sphaerotilus hippei]